MEVSAIRIGEREVGADRPCFIVAEVGLNHNGDLELAKRSVVAAAQSGADAVKFQNYRTEDFLSDKSLQYTYTSQSKSVTESQWDMFKRCEPPSEWWPEIKGLCEELGVIFFSTPTSEDGVDELVRIGAAAIKNGSDYLTHTPLIEYMSRTGLPVILSTGMADEQEIDDAVAAYRRGRAGAGDNAGSEGLILLHCTSAYPTQPASTNLLRMLSLGSRYLVPTGFSDHTEGYQAACQAVTLGACMIEKHFTLDNNLPGPDHWFSSTPDQFAILTKQVREAELRLGDRGLSPAAVESTGRELYRLGMVAASDISRSTKLTKDLVVFRRPAKGLVPADLPNYIGKTISRDLRQGESFEEADFE